MIHPLPLMLVLHRATEEAVALAKQVTADPQPQAAKPLTPPQWFDLLHVEGYAGGVFTPVF